MKKPSIVGREATSYVPVRALALSIGRGSVLALLGLALLFVPASNAAILDHADYLFTGSNLPDPAVWTAQGTGRPIPISGSGLAIANSGGSPLVYAHLTPIAPEQSATFRVVVKTPFLDDGSVAWANDASGVVAALDDGVSSAQIAFARDPANANQRVLRLRGVAGPPLVFTWDNDAFNTYEISFNTNHTEWTLRVVNGGNGNTVTRTIAVGNLPPTLGAAGFYWGVSGLGGSVWQSVHGEIAAVPFAAFNAEFEIERDEFEVKGSFTLGAGSNGINPPSEDVTLQIGTFSTTIPAGSFMQDKKGRFKFEGTINGVALEFVIRPLGGNSFEFQAEGKGANLTGTTNPVTVTLTIGDDSGSTIVIAEFE